MLSVTVRYQQASLIFTEQAIPWNADLVEVEVLCRLPSKARRRVDFSLHAPGLPALLPETLLAENEDHHRLLFRLSPPAESTRCELRFQQHRLAPVMLPVMSPRDFNAALKFSQVTLAVRLGEQTTVAPRFVARHSQGFIASAVLSSPMPLASLTSSGLRVVFRNEGRGAEYSVDIPLSRSQMQSREALVTAFLPRKPGFLGPWQVMWVTNGDVKAVARVQGLALREFHQSLRVLDSKFVVSDRQRGLRVVRQLPPLQDVACVGPCFLLASSDPGIAGRCRLSLNAVFQEGGPNECLAEQDVLLTDAGAVFAPVLMQVPRLRRVAGFELRHRSRVLASLSLSPIPRATFNAEGAYKPPSEFLWSASAEEELHERLLKLMKGSEDL